MRACIGGIDETLRRSFARFVKQGRRIAEVGAIIR
jgi:hypothetical protein